MDILYQLIRRRKDNRMTVDKVVSLLDDKGIRIVVEKDKIYEDNRLDMTIPLENHYGLMERINEWDFCFIKLEKRNIPEVEILKSFTNYGEALTYFFLNRIYNFYIQKFVVPARDYNVMDWSVPILIEQLQRLGIPEKYISYGKNIHSNSIYYFEENNLWFSAYIDHDKNIVAKSNMGMEDKNWFFSLGLNDIYPLYLLDEYEKVLLENKEILEPFSEIDRGRFLEFDV